ncbi:S8 family serine peptidase [Clostridiaceae bacterium M8S5]|nr:S8 family serine peptidase [Clostridiaceae bacterium M8S5]
MFSRRRILSLVMCVLVVLSLSSLGMAKEKFEPETKLMGDLCNIMEEAKTDELIPVIVIYKDNEMTASSNEIVELKSNSNVKHVYQNIPGVALSLTKEQIKELENSDMIKHIEFDQEVQMCLDKANYWFGTEKARTDFGLDGNRDGSSSYSKDDVVIAVIDTGIDGNHVDLDNGKIIGWKDYISNKTTPYDDQGHGTHCASIAAGDGDGNANYKGVAPGAALVGVKVLNSWGSGSMSDVTAAIDWCSTNKDVYGIDIISMSLGTRGSSDGQDAASLAVNNAVANGITVAVAAGNSGPYKKSIGSPGAAEDAITVGNMIDVGEKGFGLIYHSSRGPTKDGRIKPDITAPGTNIYAAKSNSTNGYTNKTGTSMSTPFIAGTAALMLDANPSLSPSQIKNTMGNTAIDWGVSGKDVDYGHGRLDAYEAIKSAGSLTGTNIDTPDHYHKAEDLAAVGSEDIWTFNVTSTSNPIAITMIIPDYVSYQNPDFDITLIGPNGSQVASHNSYNRQRTILYYPVSAGTGNYKLKIKSAKGTGNYFFDLSCDGGTLTLTQDQ